jgi:hypothetical protein
MPDNEPDAEVDPEEFVRAMLNISPEDAAKVRERTPGTRQRKSGEEPGADQRVERPSK